MRMLEKLLTRKNLRSNNLEELLKSELMRKRIISADFKCANSASSIITLASVLVVFQDSNIPCFSNIAHCLVTLQPPK